MQRGDVRDRVIETLAPDLYRGGERCAVNGRQRACGFQKVVVLLTGPVVVLGPDCLLDNGHVVNRPATGEPGENPAPVGDALGLCITIEQHHRRVLYSQSSSECPRRRIVDVRHVIDADESQVGGVAG